MVAEREAEGEQPKRAQGVRVPDKRDHPAAAGTRYAVQRAIKLVLRTGRRWRRLEKVIYRGGRQGGVDESCQLDQCGRGEKRCYAKNYE
jgi:hypothetical protein